MLGKLLKVELSCVVIYFLFVLVDLFKVDLVDLFKVDLQLMNLEGSDR